MWFQIDYNKQKILWYKDCFIVNLKIVYNWPLMM